MPRGQDQDSKTTLLCGCELKFDSCSLMKPLTKLP